MSLVYRVMGEHIREIGKHAGDGEAIHEATTNRRDLPECQYAAKNLDFELPLVNTTRIERGQPCRPL